MQCCLAAQRALYLFSAEEQVFAEWRWRQDLGERNKLEYLHEEAVHFHLGIALDDKASPKKLAIEDLALFIAKRGLSHRFRLIQVI